MCAKRVVTLTIESGSIRLLSLKGSRIEKWGSAAIEPGIVREGLVLNPEALAVAVDAIFTEVGLPKKNVIVSLMGMQSTFRIISLPQMKDKLLDQAVQRAAAREIPVPPEELKVVWQPLGRKAGSKGQEIFVLGVPKASVKAEVQALAGCGIKPLLMDAKKLALVRAVNKRNGIILNLEPDSFGIILVANGLPNIVRTIIPRGGEATLVDNIYRLLGEVLRTVEFYNREHLDSNLDENTPVYLTGELADNTDAVDIIESEIGYPVESLAPPLKYKPGFTPAAYAVNIGLALRSKQPAKKRTDAGIRDIRLNILAVRVEPRTVPVGHVLLWLLVLLAAGSLYLSYQGLKSAQDDTDVLRAELNAVNREFSRAQLILGEATSVNEIVAQADALEQFNKSIFALDMKTAEVLKTVLKDIPAGATASGLITDPEEITIEGSSDNPSSVIAYARALEAEWLFDPVSIVQLDEEGFTISLGR